MMSSSSGYFSAGSAGSAAAAAAAAPAAAAVAAPLSTLAPLPSRTSTISSAAAAAGGRAASAAFTNDNDDNLAELAEIVNFAAAAVSSSNALPPPPPPPPTTTRTTTTTTTKAPAAAAASATKPPATLPLPIEERVRQVKTEAGGIWIHGEPSSTVEPGFRAIICLDAKPVVLPTYLGLPTPTGPHDSLRHSVFLQRTSNPNEMFGRWAEDEAADAAAAEVNSNNANIAAAAATGGGANRQQRSRLTMRIRLDEYLTLLGVVREEWKLLETGLTSAARQLSGLDQPMPIDPLMAYLGFGTCIERTRMGPRFVMHAFLESRYAASAGIRIQLELLPTSPSQVVQRMEVPFPTLVAMATKSLSSLADLYERWYFSLSPQQRQQQERRLLQCSIQQHPPPLPLQQQPLRQQSSSSSSPCLASSESTTATTAATDGKGRIDSGSNSRHQRGDLNPSRKRSASSAGTSPERDLLGSATATPPPSGSRGNGGSSSSTAGGKPSSSPQRKGGSSSSNSSGNNKTDDRRNKRHRQEQRGGL